MNRRDVAVLCFKVIAIFVALRILSWIEHFGMNWSLVGNILTGAEKDIYQKELLFSILPLVAIIVTATILWRKSEYLAAKVFPNAEVSNIGPTLQPWLRQGDILKLAIKLIGIWLILSTLAGLLTQAIFSFVPYAELLPDSTRDYYVIQQKVHLATLSLKFLLGLVLLFWQPVGKWVQGVLFFENQEAPALPLQEVSQLVLCPYCKNPLTETENVPCPKCGTLYHVNCWSEHPSCSIYGCGPAAN